MNNNITPFPKRGRPEGVLAQSLNVTALALDNEQWDGPESGLLVDAYRDALRIACDGDADERSRATASRLAIVLAQLIDGDRAENARHGRQLGTLRVLNGRLDGKEEPAVLPAG